MPPVSYQQVKETRNRNTAKITNQIVSNVLTQVNHAREVHADFRENTREASCLRELYGSSNNDDESSFSIKGFPQVYTMKQPVVPKREQAKKQAPVREPEPSTNEGTTPNEEAPVAPEPEEVIKEAVLEIQEKRREIKPAPRPPREPTRPRELVLGDWLKYTMPYHITAGDIRSLRKGDVIVAVCLNDRLVSHALSDSVNRRGTVSPPQKFLRCNSWIVYTHERDYHGKATFYTQNVRSGQIEYFSVDKPFEFHVEYERDTWFPLSRGVMNRTQFLEEHSEYPDDFEITSNTRLGFGGPMIILQNLEKCPHISRRAAVR